jgi:excisionase family DNA binding protein
MAGAEPGFREFLTVAEIAELLKMNPQSIRNWIDAGKLPAYRVGRRVRVSRADFDALINSGRTTRAVPEVTAHSFTAQDFWSGERMPDQAVNEASRSRQTALQAEAQQAATDEEDLEVARRVRAAMDALLSAHPEGT